MAKLNTEIKAFNQIARSLQRADIKCHMRVIAGEVLDCRSDEYLDCQPRRGKTYRPHGHIARGARSSHGTIE